MPFQGPQPLGTAGGFDNANLATEPEVWRLAVGTAIVAYLRINTPLEAAVHRSQVESVTRVLGLAGDLLTGVVMRENGGVRDSNARDVDTLAGLTAANGSNPGEVLISVESGGITTSMLADGAIT